MRKFVNISLSCIILISLAACSSPKNKSSVGSTDSTTIAENIKVAETEETFNADSSKYLKKMFKKFKDIPEQINENGKSMSLVYVSKFDKDTEYTAYYEPKN